MPFNISTFREEIHNNGYLKKNQFNMTVHLPRLLQNAVIENVEGGNDTRNISKMMEFRIANVRTPQITVSTVNVQRYGVGPVHKYPFSTQFNEIIFTVTCDKLGDVWRFWHNWVREVFDATGGADQRSGNINELPNYDAGFREDYSSTFELRLFTPEGENAVGFNLFDAYPVVITEVPISWADPGIVELTLSAHYREYVIVGTNLRRQQTLTDLLQ
jgi:hypothetical protein